jgi:hypothetical protein
MVIGEVGEQANQVVEGERHHTSQHPDHGGNQRNNFETVDGCNFRSVRFRRR